MIGHRVALRPRDLADIADVAATFLRRHWKTFAKLLPWTLVPAALVFLLQRWLDLEFWSSTALLLTATAIGSGVYVVLLGDLMLAEEVDLRSVQRRFLGGLFRSVVARLLAWFVAFLSLGFAYANAAFVPECSLLERDRATASLGRSGALMRATGGRSFGFLFLVFLLVAIGAVGGELARFYLRVLFGLSTSHVTFFSHPLGWASVLGVALVAPYLETFRFFAYIDARTRREGWDLQVQMNALVDAAEARRASRSEAA